MTDEPKLDFRLDIRFILNNLCSGDGETAVGNSNEIIKILSIVNGLTMSEVERRLTAKCENCKNGGENFGCSIRLDRIGIPYCDGFLKKD